jgi:hypothetical protein
MHADHARHSSEHHLPMHYGSSDKHAHVCWNASIAHM